MAIVNMSMMKGFDSKNGFDSKRMSGVLTGDVGVAFGNILVSF
jgi:hypothetical protein